MSAARELRGCRVLVQAQFVPLGKPRDVWLSRPDIDTPFGLQLGAMNAVHVVKLREGGVVPSAYLVLAAAAGDAEACRRELRAGADPDSADGSLTARRDAYA